MTRRGPVILLAGILIGLPLGAVGDEGGEEAGEAAFVIARTCVTCHHPDNRDIPAVPGDMDRETLATRLSELREPDETVTVMHRLMTGIDEDDIPALARVLTERP